jgi:hypothetical protein
MSASLLGCAKHTDGALKSSPFLEPTVIEGTYKSIDAVIADPNSTTFDLYRFGGAAEDAVGRCNADKQSEKNRQGSPC